MRVTYFQLFSFLLLAFATKYAYSESGDSTETTGSQKTAVEFSVGIEGGYCQLNMKDVNEDLKEWERIIGVPKIAEQINGGMYLGGNATVSIGTFLVGIEGNVISAEAGVGYDDGTGRVAETYKVKTLEIVGLAGVRLSLDKKGRSFLDLKAGGGYGNASADFSLVFYDYLNPSQNIDVRADLSGAYFASRGEATLVWILGRVQLSIGGGYRLGNAGILKGPMNVNGVSVGDQPAKGFKGNDISFDYSGAFGKAGIAFAL